MAYEMNEGGYLSGSFVQAQYDRNQEWQDYQRSQAAAESYWKQLKMQQEMERSADLNKLNDALTADMVPLGAEVDEYGHKRVKLGYAKEAKPVAPDVHSVAGGLAVVGPDGQPTWYQSPWATDKPAKEFTTVSGRGGHWVYGFDGVREWVPDPASESATTTGGWDDPAAALKWAQSNGIANPKVTFEAGKYRVLPGEAPVDEFDRFRDFGRRGMFNALLEGDKTKARNAAMMVNGLPVSVPSPLGGTVGVDLATAGEDPLTRALGRFAVDPVTNSVGSATNSTPVGASSSVAPVSSGGTVLQMGMDGSVRQSATDQLKVAARGGNVKAQEYLKSKNIIW
jgi:hypothetical protein